MDEKMNIMPQYPIPSYKYGGIHIKKRIEVNSTL